MRLRRQLRNKEFRHAYADEHLNLSISTQIKSIREQQRMSQADLAQIVGTKQTGISRIESANYSGWSIAVLRRVAQAFDLRLKVSFEEFGTLWREVDDFSRESLHRRKFEDDPEFREAPNSTHSDSQDNPDANAIAVRTEATPRRKAALPGVVVVLSAGDVRSGLECVQPAGDDPGIRAAGAHRGSVRAGNGPQEEVNNMEEEETLEAIYEQYRALCHAMQSGVAAAMNYDSAATEPKHLRTGVNSAMVSHAALAELLLRKGVITEREYFMELRAKMREEVEKYEAELSARVGGAVKLG